MIHLTLNAPKRRMLPIGMALILFFFLLFACSKEEVEQMQDGQDSTPNIEACFVVPASEVYLGDTVEFDNCTLGASSFQWDLGDGTTSTQTNARHAYERVGDYTISLVGYDSQGRGGEISTQTLRVEYTPYQRAAGLYEVDQRCNTGDDKFFVELRSSRRFLQLFDLRWEFDFELDPRGVFNIPHQWYICGPDANYYDFFGASGQFSPYWDTLRFDFRLQNVSDSGPLHECSCTAVRQ